MEQMRKFGKVEQCYIPPTEGHSRSSKIAIVRYKRPEEASRAVEEREVNIEFSAVTIERAIERKRQDRRDRDRAGGTFGQQREFKNEDFKRRM